MEEKLKFKYVILYILFLTLQLAVFMPKTVVGINIPVLYVYLFNILDNRHILTFKQRIPFDTNFIALLLAISSIILLLINYPFWATLLLIVTIAIFRKE